MSKPTNLMKSPLLDVGQVYIKPEAYKKDLLGILVSEGLVLDRVKKLGQEISQINFRPYPVFLKMLEGADRFCINLVREMTIPLEIISLKASSYQGTTSTGRVDFGNFNPGKLTGRDVVIIEDIVDTAKTLTETIKKIEESDPNRIYTVTLLEKPDRRLYEVQLDFVGFTIPNHFVVGFWMDYNERYRDLNHIGVLKKEIYQRD